MPPEEKSFFMNELSAVLWTVGGAASFSVVGGAFGAVAGGLSWRNGNASGSLIGTKVARAIRKILDRELTPTQEGSIIGGADGAFFLGLIGALVGLIVHFTGGEPSEWLLPAFLILISLLTGALLFGLLAYGMLRLRVHSIFTVCLGGLIGATVTAWKFGPSHIVPGAVAGIFSGALLYYAIFHFRR